MCRELVGLFSGRVERDRGVYFVFYCEGHFFVASVYRGTGGIDQVLDTIFAIVVGVAAGFKDVVEADQIAFDVDAGDQWGS